jgi:hypothetical protein
MDLPGKPYTLSAASPMAPRPIAMGIANRFSRRSATVPGSGGRSAALSPLQPAGDVTGRRRTAPVPWLPSVSLLAFRQDVQHGLDQFLVSLTRDETLGRI